MGRLPSPWGQACPGQVQINALKFVYFLKAQLEEREERGATAVEYGLMVALIAAVIVGAVGLLGTQVRDTFNSVAGRIHP